MRFFSLVAVALFLAACGGMTARSKVVQTASFEHRCPAESVHVVQANDEIWAYVLDVCGKERRYRDMGNSKEFQFVDVTDGTAGKPAAAD